MVEGEANPHVNQKEKPETAERLHVSRKERGRGSRKAENKKNACGGTNRALVEHRNINALDFFTEGRLRGF